MSLLEEAIAVVDAYYYDYLGKRELMNKSLANVADARMKLVNMETDLAIQNANFNKAYMAFHDKKRALGELHGIDYDTHKHYAPGAAGYVEAKLSFTLEAEKQKAPDSQTRVVFDIDGLPTIVDSSAPSQ